MSLPPSNGALHLGEYLGPYRIVRRLGHGGMGAVYEAVEEALHRRVALKVIAPEVAEDAGFRRRFVHEARAQASLDSPHVVQVFAHGEIDGRLYIASQLIPDGDLGAMLRRHGPPPRQVALSLIGDVAEGLAEAHRAGLVHRDIKPANVLLRKRGTDMVAYLTDFGIAHHLDAQALADQGSAAAGTPGYLAPELHAGASAGPASDIYSLGCLLWATLTGSAPYAGLSNAALVEAHASAPIPHVRGRAAADRDLNRVLRAALAKESAERYRSVAAFSADLDPLSRAAHAPGRRPAGPVRAVIGVLALVAVLTALLSGVFGHAGQEIGALPGVREANRAASLPTLTSAPGGSDASTVQARAVDNIAKALVAHGGVDAGGARCIAAELVGTHGVERLQRAGLLGDDLMLIKTSAALDPKALADIFSTSFSCLFREASTSASPR
ncbi:MAG: serine/threonine protein kinase [Nocardioidaceae bacterium]|nr:serine/threonine protein kinase [Nocardioidaceae bacterium]